jgi:hypothetical protein
VLDQQPVDLLLRQRVVPRRLPRVDDHDVRLQLVEQASRGQPVDHDDVCLGQQPAPTGGDQPRVTGAAADERDRPGVRPTTAHRQPAGVQGEGDGVADPHGAHGVTPSCDRDGDVSGASDGRGPGRGQRCVVGAHAPHPGAFGVRRDQVVGGRIASGGVHQPGTVQVAAGVVTGEPGHGPGVDEVVQVLADPR